MPSKLAAFTDRLLEASWLMVALVIPLFFNVYSARVFEPDKLTAFRAIMTLALCAWMVRELEMPGAPGNLLRRWYAGLRANPFGLPLAVLTASYLLSTVLSIQPTVSIFGSYQRLQGTLNNLLYFALFLLVATGLRNWARVDRLITAFIITSVPVSFYGCIQHFGLDPLPWGGDVQTRVAGSAGNPIFLGAYIILVMPFIAMRMLNIAWKMRANPLERQNSRNWTFLGLYAAAFLLNGTCLLWTGSRGPWLGFAASVLVFCFIWAVSMRAYKLVWATVGGAAVLAGFLVFLNSPYAEQLRQQSSVLQRLGSIAELDQGTNKVRMLIWFGDDKGKGAAGLITANPFRTVVGYGPETMYVAYNRFYPPSLANIESRTATPDRSHNDLLDFLVTNGAIGLFAYLLVVVTFFTVVLKLARNVQPGYQRFLLLAVSAGVTAHMVEALIGIPIASTRTHFWMIMGIAAAMPTLLAPQKVPEPAIADGEGAKGKAEPAGAKSRRRNQQRKSTPPARRLGPVGGWTKTQAIPIALWLVITILFVWMLLTRVEFANAVGQQNYPTVLVFGAIGWVWLGILVLGYALPRPASGPAGRNNAAFWLVAPVLGIIGLFLAVNLANPIIADIRFKQAQSYDSASRYDLSVPTYLQAIKSAPHEDFYYLFLGRALLEAAKRAPDTKQGPPAQTVADLQAFANINGIGRDSLYRASQVALDEAYKISPLNTDHSANLGRLYRFWAEVSANPDDRAKRLDESDKWYANALQLSPNAAHLWTEWGLTLEAQGRIDDALAKYDHATYLDQFYSPTYLQLGNLYLNQANQKNAQGDKEGYSSLLEKAAGYYRHVTEIDPNQAGAHSALGYIYVQQGKTQEALAENQTVAKLAPNDLATRRNLALLYRDTGNKTQALIEARMAMSIAPADQKPQLAALVAELERAN